MDTVEPNQPSQAVARAIAALTAWLETDNDRGFLSQEILRTLEEGAEAEAALTVGLVNVAGLLLLRLERITGVAPAETLQDLARRHPAT